MLPNTPMTGWHAAEIIGDFEYTICDGRGDPTGSKSTTDHWFT